MHPSPRGVFDDEYVGYLLDTYSATLVRLCFSYVKNMHDAEDLAQDVFCELIKRRPLFESSEHEKAWLLRAAVNRCKNHLKSAHVKKTVSFEDLPGSENLPAENSDPYEKNSGEVFEAVMSLPEKYRTVIHMYYYSGFDLAEIAAAQHIPAATAGTRLARARALLKKMLGDEF